MAQRKGAAADDLLSNVPETDTVEQEYGAEYSEDTLDLMRRLRKAPQLDDESSLDPVDDLGAHLEHGLKLPPKVYDALQEAGQEIIQELQESKDAKADPALQEAVRYRQRLTEGASYDDLAWLKLRAYHRAADQLHAEAHTEKADVRRQRMEEYEVPMDRVPAELLDLTPTQLAERRKLAAAASSRAAARAGSKARSTLVAESSEEGAADVRELVKAGPSWADADARAALGQALQSSLISLGVLKPPAPPQTQQPASSGPTAAHVPVRPTPCTIYTQTYQQEQQLRKKVNRQKVQRSLAFWLSLVTVTGTYMVRYVRRAMVKQALAAQRKAARTKELSASASTASVPASIATSKGGQ